MRHSDRMDAAESLILMCVPGADRCARVGGGRNYGGLLGGGSLMKPSACGLRLAVVNDVWDNGVTDVVGVIGQGVIMLHHACVRVRYNGTMLMPSGPCAPRPRLPPITVGSQALQSTLSTMLCSAVRLFFLLACASGQQTTCSTFPCATCSTCRCSASGSG